MCKASGFLAVNLLSSCILYALRDTQLTFDFTQRSLTKRKVRNPVRCGGISSSSSPRPLSLGCVGCTTLKYNRNKVKRTQPLALRFTVLYFITESSRAGSRGES